MNKSKLIEKLMEIYPYSKEWFLNRTERALWAMYYNSSRSNSNFSLTNAESKEKFIDGRRLILTDAGVWEEAID